MDKNLTAMQENWCMHYVEHGNKSEAYRFAYSVDGMNDTSVRKEASRLSQIPHIIERVEEIRKELFQELNINVLTVVKDFKEIKERCMQSEPVTDMMGQPTGEWKFDANAATKANIELGKIIGVYEKDNTQKLEKSIDLSNLTDKEVIQYMKLLSKAKS